MVVGVVPGIDFRQPQVPASPNRARPGRLRREALAPAALHDVKAHLDIRLARRIDPRPQSATPDKTPAPDKPAAALEQRPVLHAGGSLALELSAELLLDMCLG